MLPGKKYKPEDLLFVLKRRFWLLIVPFALVSAGTAVFVRKLPDRYMSQATILVVPQKVPEAYVKAPGARIQDRLRTIQQGILSRTRARKDHRGVQPLSQRAQERDGDHAGRRAEHAR